MRDSIVTKGPPSRGQWLRIRKSHFEGTSASSSVVSDNGAGRTTTRAGGSSRGRSPFREALDEAKEQLARVRRQCKQSEGSLPYRTRLSVHDESGKVSVSYQEIDHTLESSSPGDEKGSPPKRVANRSGSEEESYHSDGCSTRKKSGRKTKTGYLVELKGSRRKGQPEEKRSLPRGTRPGRNKEHGHDDEFRCRPWRGMEVSCNALGCKDEDSGRSNGRRVASPRRAETACVEVTHGSSAEEDVELYLKLERTSKGDTANNTGIISRRGRKQGATSSSFDLRAKSAAIRSSRSERSEQSAPRASRDYSRPRVSLDPCKFEAQRESKESIQANGYLHARQREGTVGASLGSCGGEERIGGKEAEGKRPSCFDSVHHLNGTCTSDVKDEEEGCFAPRTRRGDYDYRGKWNRDHSERITAKERHVNEENQHRWSTRGRVLWATHAEPAARATSTDCRVFPRATRRSGSQPVVRPYHGLYARSLQANGIEPANFRSSRCSCQTTEHRQIDGSVLWPDRENAAGTRSPADGLPDRLEAGRVLDSFERRAELLGKMPPTTLRAKTAWMEKPGDPQYRCAHGTTASMLHHVLRCVEVCISQGVFAHRSNDTMPDGRRIEIISCCPFNRLKKRSCLRLNLFSQTDVWTPEEDEYIDPTH